MVREVRVESPRCSLVGPKLKMVEDGGFFRWLGIRTQKNNSGSIAIRYFSVFYSVNLHFIGECRLQECHQKYRTVCLKSIVSVIWTYDVLKEYKTDCEWIRTGKVWSLSVWEGKQIVKLQCFAKDDVMEWLGSDLTPSGLGAQSTPLPRTLFHLSGGIRYPHRLEFVVSLGSRSPGIRPGTSGVVSLSLLLRWTLTSFQKKSGWK